MLYTDPMQSYQQFEDRKRGHIRHSLSPESQATVPTGLASVHLRHEALPELDLSHVTLTSRSLGPHFLKTPFYIAGMTAGHPDAATINLRIARACESRGWAMGVGSQRRQLTDPKSEIGLKGLAALRVEAPSLFLLGNIGLAQASIIDPEQILNLVDTIRAQGVAIHLNGLQEVMQIEGTPQFAGGLDAILKITRSLQERGVFVVLKETGCGFSEATLKKIHAATVTAPLAAPLAAIDVSGLGGTHWGKIEGLRAQDLVQDSEVKDPTQARAARIRAQAAQTFAAWGETTVQSVIRAARVFKGTSTQIWASGGVRSGLDAAKLIALGASAVGYAKPALEAALAGDAALDEWMELQEFELKAALFCTGCASPEELRQKDQVWSLSDT